MKRFMVLVLVILQIFILGCSNIQVKENSTKLSEQEALRLVSEGSKKYSTVTLLGYGIDGCTFEKSELVEVNGDYYNYFCSELDTLEEFNSYLDNVYTEKSILSIMDIENIIVYEGKVLKLNADAGGGLYWGEAEIVSLNQNEETAEVEFKVPSAVGEGDIENILIPFKYIENKGWRIDTETPFYLY